MYQKNYLVACYGLLRLVKLQTVAIKIRYNRLATLVIFSHTFTG
jgi:hypothetical protein